MAFLDNNNERAKFVFFFLQFSLPRPTFVFQELQQKVMITNIENTIVIKYKKIPNYEQKHSVVCLR